MDAFWIVLTGGLVALPAALLGSVLVLRRQAMLGDAVSHAVLPGIVLAYLATGDRASPALLAGAAAVGLITTLSIDGLHRRLGVRADAAIAFVYTALFASGVVLLTGFAARIDLDLDCVLFGEIAYVPLRPWLLADGTNLGPTAVWTLGTVALLVGGWVLARYRELQLTTFDPDFAHCTGLRPQRLHLELMGLVSLLTVASFEAVGAVLIVALLVVPAAAAALVAVRFGGLLAGAAALGVASAAGGYVLAVGVDGNIAGGISVVAGLSFAAALGWRSWRRRTGRIFEPVLPENSSSARF